MAYDKSMYLAVKQRMDERRLRAQMEAAERKEELYAALPQLEQLDRKLAAGTWNRRCWQLGGRTRPCRRKNGGCWQRPG